MNSKTAPKLPNLLKYHRPKLRLNEARIPPLSQESKECLRNLVAYRAPKTKLTYPRSSCAAVLVALFVGRKGDLYVLLNRRSLTLRTYAGDTSLPGGRMDPEDKSFEDTARREAYEEIGLPRDRHKVPLLCLMEPYLAAQHIVVPVVVLILDNTLRPILNAAEVASLFSHPLASFLTSTPPFPSEPESVEVPYHSHYEVESTGPRGTTYPWRVHRFLTGREAGGIRPVFGITAAILINVAQAGYRRVPEFEVHPPGEPPMERRIAWALLTRPVFQRACKEEGIDVSVAREIAGLIKAEELVSDNLSGNEAWARKQRLAKL